MRYSNFFTGAVAVALIISGSAPFALAKENGEGGNSTAIHTIDENSQGTSSSEINDNENEGDNNDVHEGDRHQKDIEEIVHALKALGEKDQNINEEVQTIADEEASSSQEAGQAMNAVAQRNFFLSLLFGTDYKSIGTLRSTLATTQNHIDQLSKLKDKTLSVDVKAGIDTQIAALQKANADAEAFVQAHENSFSLLGWFFKFFNT